MVKCSKSCRKSCSFQSFQNTSPCTKIISNRAVLLQRSHLPFLLAHLYKSTELLLSLWRGHWRHTLKYYIKVFYVMGKALSGELSYTGTGLVDPAITMPICFTYIEMFLVKVFMMATAFQEFTFVVKYCPFYIYIWCTQPFFDKL